MPTHSQTSLLRFRSNWDSNSNRLEARSMYWLSSRSTAPPTPDSLRSTAPQILLSAQSLAVQPSPAALREAKRVPVGIVDVELARTPGLIGRALVHRTFRVRANQ